MDETLLNDLLNSWENAEERRARGENVSDWDMARRISAVTEGDNLTGRIQEAIQEHKVTQKFDEKIRAKQNRGQTEEEFQEELSDFGGFVRKAWKEARSEVK